MQTPHPHEFYILKTPNNIDHKIYNKKKKSPIAGVTKSLRTKPTPENNEGRTKQGVGQAGLFP